MKDLVVGGEGSCVRIGIGYVLWRGREGDGCWNSQTTSQGINEYTAER